MPRHPRFRLRELLDSSGVPYELLTHPRAATAEEAAALRGTPLAIGGKSLLFKVEKRFALFVLSGARRTDNRALRRHLGAQRLRFARAEELAALTGLTPGCVPPFGSLFDLPLYVDTATAEQPEIAFSLADHTLSVRMKTADYLAIARPVAIYSFSKDQIA